MVSLRDWGTWLQETEASPCWQGGTLHAVDAMQSTAEVKP